MTKQHEVYQELENLIVKPLNKLLRSLGASDIVIKTQNGMIKEGLKIAAKQGYKEAEAKTHMLQTQIDEMKKQLDRIEKAFSGIIEVSA